MSPGRAAGRDAGRRVLVVGIDGVRFDRLGEAVTPTVLAVGRGGFLAPVRVDDAGPTISGPCWATVATGRSADVHGIADNDTPPERPLPPDFLTVARDAGRATLAVAAWTPLVRPVGCGPIFAGGGQVPLDPGEAHDGDTWDAADEAVVRCAGAALAGGAVDAAFVYLGLADEVAHARGCGADYAGAIARCDPRLARLLEATGGGPAVDRPVGGGWTVIVVTDHGHRAEGGHGGDTDAERTAWIAACGPGIPGRTPAGLAQADIAAQVLATLGVPGNRPPWAQPQVSQ